MRPLDIEILMHYCVTTARFPRADAPECKRTIEEFIAQGYLSRNAEEVIDATDGARLYLEALKAVPLPMRQWVIPK